MQKSALPQSFLQAPIAHRGLHSLSNGVPENSLASFEAAIARGYGIELDLQLSQDGIAMVFHDYSLERLTSEKAQSRSAQPPPLEISPSQAALKVSRHCLRRSLLSQAACRF